MVSGHTDRTTINARRPLTPRMRETLAWIDTRERAGAWLRNVSFSNAGRNAARALMDRGLAEPEPNGRWRCTDAGRAVLEEKPK